MDASDALVTATASRRVLGIMNDMALHIEYAIHDAGGVGSIDVSGLNRELRRGLHTRAGSYARPLELARQRPAAGHEDS